MKPAALKITLSDAGGMAPSIPLPGIVGCTGCGWGANIGGAEHLPANRKAFCPRCAYSMGFGDGSGWEIVPYRPRRRSGPPRSGRRRKDTP